MTQSDIEKIARAMFDLDWPCNPEYWHDGIKRSYLRDAVSFSKALKALKSLGYTEIV